MNISAIYDPRTKNLELQYDREAKVTFAQSARHVRFFFNSLPAIPNRPKGVNVPADYLRGLAVLTRLGYPSARDPRMKARDIRFVLKVTSAAALFCCERKKSFSPLDTAVVLLAEVTPILLRQVDLPPPAEVFDKTSTPLEAWNTYREIRGWGYVRPPEIFLIRLYRLWLELKSIPHLGGNLQSFADQLGDVTADFRLTMLELGRFEFNQRDEKE
jgi:hypothetical protein